MTMPAGFLGTRADLLLDLVIVSLVVVVPLLLVSWSKARQRQYSAHKTFQITLLAVLTVAVGAFEANMSSLGGIFAATSASQYAGTTLLNGWIWFHTACAILTTLLWFGLLIASLRRFPKPPAPNGFSSTHRVLGRIGMIMMALTGLTSIPVYVYGFAY
jgi:putative membrane protein